MKSIKQDATNYTIKYQVTLWDYFGLDITDIEVLPNTIPLAKEAFAAWFALQHLRGYKPFITKITFEKEFTGNMKEGKFDRVKIRENELKEKELKQKSKNAKNPFYMSPGKI